MRGSLATALLVLSLACAESCSSHTEPVASGGQALEGACGAVTLTAYTDSNPSTYTPAPNTSYFIPSTVALGAVLPPGPSSGNSITATVAFSSANVTCTYSRTAVGNSTDYDPLPLQSCGVGLGAGSSVTESTQVSLSLSASLGGELSATLGLSVNLDDGLPCTQDTCTNGVVAHEAIYNQAVPGSDLCTSGVWYCDGSATLTKPPAMPPIDNDPCVTTSCTPYVGWTSTPISQCGVPNVDGGVPAYAGNGTVPSDIGSGMAFVYTGANAIQTGCNPGPCSNEIVTQHVATIRGQVIDRNTSANVGAATITILNHPEFGTTLTRSDGWFDIAVNGGAPYVVQIVASGYMTVQRTAQTRWLDWTVLPQIAMVAPELTTTGTCPSIIAGNPAVTLGASGWQCVQGLPHGETQGDDLDPSRTATIIVPPNTSIGSCVGSTNCSGGSWTGSNTVTMHATEFTVGDVGRSALPGDLPPQSAYTYAVEAGIVEAGSTSVTFANAYNNDVFFYIENFTGAPLDATNATNQVPAGSYDRTRGVWQPEQNGKVYCIMSTTGGLAHMSIDNCTTELTADVGGNYTGESPAISSGERQELASIYTGVTNKKMWRVAMPHFSSWDLNWVLLNAIGPIPLPTRKPTATTPVDDPDCKRRSIVECQNQVLGEDLPIVGTPYSLHYRSEAQNGYRPTITVPITENPTGGFGYLSQIQVEIQVAGQDHDLVVNPPFSPNQAISWSWDRTDAYGRPVSGQVLAAAIVTYVFTAPAFTASAVANGFTQYQAAATITGNRAERRLVVRKPYYLPIGEIDDKLLGFGGWTFSDEHLYEPQSHTLWMGDGKKRSGGEEGDFITTFYNDATGTPLVGVAGASDGTLYAAHSGQHTGDIFLASVENGGPLTQLSYTNDGNHTSFTSGVTPLSAVGLTNGVECVVAGADQTVYLCNYLRIVRAGAPPNYSATLVAGLMQPGGCGGTNCCTADGDVVAGSGLHFIRAIALGPDGTVFFSEADTSSGGTETIGSGCNPGAAWVRYISADGRVHTLAGGGTTGSLTVGVPAVGQPVTSVNSIAVGPDGMVYFTNGAHVWQVAVDGILRNFAGGGNGPLGDNGPATIATLHDPSGLALHNGAMTIVDYNGNRVRQVDQSGTITTVAGTGVPDSGVLLVDNTLATIGTVSPSNGAWAPDGWFYMNDTANLDMIRRFKPIGDPVISGITEVLSPNGGDVFKFDSTGRHNATVSQYGGVTRRTLNYDGSNLLTQHRRR